MREQTKAIFVRLGRVAASGGIVERRQITALPAFVNPLSENAMLRLPLEASRSTVHAEMLVVEKIRAGFVRQGSAVVSMEIAELLSIIVEFQTAARLLLASVADLVPWNCLS